MIKNTNLTFNTCLDILAKLVSKKSQLLCQSNNRLCFIADSTITIASDFYTFQLLFIDATNKNRYQGYYYLQDLIDNVDHPRKIEYSQEYQYLDNFFTIYGECSTLIINKAGIDFKRLAISNLVASGAIGNKLSINQILLKDNTAYSLQGYNNTSLIDMSPYIKEPDSNCGIVFPHIPLNLMALTERVYDDVDIRLSDNYVLLFTENYQLKINRIHSIKTIKKQQIDSVLFGNFVKKQVNIYHTPKFKKALKDVTLNDGTKVKQFKFDREFPLFFDASLLNLKYLSKITAHMMVDSINSTIYGLNCNSEPMLVIKGMHIKPSNIPENCL